MNRTICTILLILLLSATGSKALELTPIGTYATGIFDEGAAEIVAYDPDTQRVFVINADASVVDVLDISDPENPALAFSVDVTDDINPNGGVNSVDVKNGIVAVAVENNDPAMNGFVAFYDTDGDFIGSETVGVLPDAVKFSNDGQLLVVADEGEPVEDDDGNLIADPVGSVSVIDISGGVGSAVVNTLDFTAFDPMKAALSAKGIKLQDGVPVSRDLEPEFPAISEDGTQAFVTLQEANAFAVIDLTVPAIVDILPIGYKDHSKGQPELDTFSFKNLGLLGTDANGLKIKLGGFSGLWYEESSRNKLEFITVGDRGPNGSEVVAGTRTFNLPDYQARVVTFEVNTRSGRSGHNSRRSFDRGRHGRNDNAKNGSAVINHSKTVYLTREDGVTPITGLPNIPGFDEIPVDAAGNPLNYDPYGADIEGIVRDPVDGTIWMVDEYRPAIYHFDEDGTLITRLVPENTHMLGDSAMKEAEYGTDGNTEGFYGLENLPEVYNKRRANRGFEGLALDPDNRILYAFIQSPMDNPDSSTRNSSVLRILAVDVDETSGDYLMPAAEYVYLLERPVHTPNAVDKIGDAVFIGDNKFLVIERDSSFESYGKKFIFEVDLKGATNIRGMTIANETVSGTLEQQSPDDLAGMNIRPVYKQKVLNLPSIGYTPSDKAEGIALLPDGRIAVLNDNDFGIEEAEGLKPVLGLINFSDGNRLDASNDDDEINIINHPVFGLYQPDAIDSFTVGGLTYYAGANEGDVRDFDFFSEEERVHDLTLDPDVFPNASDLQEDDILGRLITTNIIGDIDDDGDNDRIFSFGARSFSIWDSFGNLVYDSSDDFETITASKLPAQFNSNNDDNDSFDARSDDKGPEPEGIEIGKIGSSTYAFIGLERIGGVMVYDVSDPTSPEFETYVNFRNFAVDAEDPAAGDLGPEGLYFIPASVSPNGEALLVVGNEVSGSTTIYEIETRKRRRR